MLPFGQEPAKLVLHVAQGANFTGGRVDSARRVRHLPGLGRRSRTSYVRNLPGKLRYLPGAGVGQNG